MSKNKYRISLLLYISAIILSILYLIFIGIDYLKINDFLSEEFSHCITIRFLEFIIPAIILFIIAKKINKDSNNDNK